MKSNSIIVFLLLLCFSSIAYACDNKEKFNKKNINSWLKKAQSGDISAQYVLGRIYEDNANSEEDSESVDMAYREAIFWYKNAARNGHADAQYSLGSMYRNSMGVPEDDSQAAIWFRKSAMQGNACAQFVLGMVHQDGYGVRRDIKETIKWYKKSAEQGHSLAQNELGYLYERGTGVKRDYDQAINWYLKAAIQGHSEAQSNLGELYERRLEMYNEAYAWHYISGKTDSEYKNKSINIEEKMTPLQIEQAQELARELINKYNLNEFFE